MCQGRGGGRPFLCPEGTKFNQRTFVCDHAKRVKCSEASNFFHRNVIVHEASIKAIPKSKSTSSNNHFIGLYHRDLSYHRDGINKQILCNKINVQHQYCYLDVCVKSSFLSKHKIVWASQMSFGLLIKSLY